MRTLLDDDVKNSRRSRQIFSFGASTQIDSLVQDIVMNFRSSIDISFDAEICRPPFEIEHRRQSVMVDDNGKNPDLSVSAPKKGIPIKCETKKQDIIFFPHQVSILSSVETGRMFYPPIEYHRPDQIDNEESGDHFLTCAICENNGTITSHSLCKVGTLNSKSDETFHGMGFIWIKNKDLRGSIPYILDTLKAVDRSEIRDE
jgi:hypothetical protein